MYAVGVIVSIIKNNKVLLHRVGLFSHFNSAVGQYSIGFRSYLEEDDRDLFSNDKIGLDKAVTKEIVRLLDRIPVSAPKDGVLLNPDLSKAKLLIDHQENEIWILVNFRASEDSVWDDPETSRLDVAEMQWKSQDGLAKLDLDNVSRRAVEELKW
jgi:hypothetical protein